MLRSERSEPAEVPEIEPGKPIKKTGRRTKKETEFIEARSPEVRGAAEKILSGFADLAEEKCPAVVEMLVKTLREKGRLEAKDVLEVVEGVADREEFREDVFARLEAVGAITRTKSGQIIADLDKISSGALRKIAFANFGKTKTTKDERCAPYVAQGRASGYFEAFRGVDVISSDDWKKGVRKGKPLFYIPDSKDDAFNVETIRTKDFYLGMWDMVDAKEKNRQDANYPGCTEAVKLNESVAAALIYHPKYGNGSRDKEGRLMVTDPETKKRIPLSGQWFKRTGYTGGTRNDRTTPFGTIESLKEYLPRYAPSLLERGLIRQSDVQSGDGISSKAEPERAVERGRIPSTGTISLHGILHHIGRQFHGKGMRIVELAHDLGGIITPDASGKEALTHTFTIYDGPAAGVTEVSNGKKRALYAGAKLTKPTQYDRKQFFRMLPGEDEDPEKFSARLKAVDDFESIQAFGRILDKEAGISLRDLPFEEQAWIARSADTIRGNKDEVYSLAKRHGVDGLRALLATEGDPNYGDAVFAISKVLDTETAKEVFSRYSELIDAVRTDTAEMLRDFYVYSEGKAVDRQKVDAALLGRSKELLERFAKKLRESKGEVDAQPFLDELDRYKKDTALFTALFKEAAKGRQVDFSEIKGVTFGERTPTELSDTERRQMLTLLDRNWQEQKPEAARFVGRALEKKLDPSNDSTRFYLLQQNGKIASFVRFDERPDLGKNAVYAGSLNVAPELRGSAIGESILAKTVDKEAKDKVVYADFFPDISAGTMYVEKFGWIVSGTESIDVSGTGTKEKRFIMVRDDEMNAQYRTRDVSLGQVELLRLAQKKNSGVESFSFTFPKDTASLLKETEAMIRSGKVMTRYFTDEKNPKIRHAIFENRIEKTSEEATA